MGRITRLVFWMPWPPPWWVWAIALAVVIAAAVVAATMLSGGLHQA